MGDQEKKQRVFQKDPLSYSDIAVVKMFGFEVSLKKTIPKELCRILLMMSTNDPRCEDLMIAKSWFTTDVFFNIDFIESLKHYAQDILFGMDVLISFKYLIHHDEGFELHTHIDPSDRIIVDVPVEGGCKYSRVIGLEETEIDGCMPHITFIPAKVPYSIKMKEGKRICTVFVIQPSRMCTETSTSLIQAELRVIKDRISNLERQIRTQNIAHSGFPVDPLTLYLRYNSIQK